jgi:hypothetical protein
MHLHANWWRRGKGVDHLDCCAALIPEAMAGVDRHDEPLLGWQRVGRPSTGINNAPCVTIKYSSENGWMCSAFHSPGLSMSKPILPVVEPTVCGVSMG